MEWWKLFGGTFILIFLAELGDKTQLAALAKTADSPDNAMAKWIVFSAASAALVASTFIAVFMGHVLKSLVPDERYIKIASAVLFLVFGGMILFEVIRSYGTPAVAPVVPDTVDVSTAPGRPGRPSVRSSAGSAGLLGELTLRAAMQVEGFSGNRYRHLARSAPPELACLLLELAKEEDGHFARLSRLDPETASSCGVGGRVSSESDVERGEISRAILAELIEHELATADFYQALATRTVIPSSRSILSSLATEERDHAERLAVMANRLQDTTPPEGHSMGGPVS